jgi:PAS domain S-box-containing protein
VVEVEGLRRDGGIFPMELSIARFESMGGVCFTGTFRDITERKRAEEELRTSRRFFEDSLDSLTAHIAILDEKGTIQYVNRAWRRFAEAHGLPRASCGPGKNYLDVCEASAKDSEEAAEMAVGIRSVMSGVMDEFVIEYPLSGPFGSRWFTASVTRFRSPGPVRVMIAHEDITPRKRSEMALVRAKDAALAAANAKSEFLANMSHEVRTPMNGILGFVEILLDSEITGEQRDHLETIRLSSESLLTVINDILDFSKIDAGKIDLEVIPFDLGELLDGVTHLMAPPAIEKGLLLTRRVTPERPWRFLGDPTRLRQVLLNLVGNAIKFTDSGAVSIAGDVEERQEGLFLLRLSVRDTGIGIPAEQRDRLFQPFSQVDGSMTRRFGGTGLGLSISRRLVELMGGRIDVRSDLGIGTSFTVTLAVEEAPEPIPASTPPSQRAPGGAGASRRPGARSLRILLAEDNAVNQKVALALLGRAGHTVEIARDGRECVEAAARGGHDLILMDVQMPAMDGLAATAAIRAREAGARRVPIIAMTAKAMKGDKEQCLEAGMDDYVTKPIRPKELLDTIDKWAETLSRRPPLGVSSGASTAPPEGTARTASLDSRGNAR